MLERARAETADPAVRYVRADLESLDLPGGAFDLAYSSLAFHYVEDFSRLVRAVARALGRDGHLVFSIEHPVYTASMRPGWLTHRDGARAWPVDHYAIEGPRVTDWLAKGVVKQHRTLASTLNALIGAGFTIERLEEWRPTPDEVESQPSLGEELDRPMMALVRARK